MTECPVSPLREVESSISGECGIYTLVITSIVVNLSGIAHDVDTAEYDSSLELLEAVPYVPVNVAPAVGGAFVLVEH